MGRRTFIGLVLLSVISDINCQNSSTFGNLIFTDTIEFSPVHDWITISNPDSCIWEIGKPDKTYFNSAHYEVRNIITDSADFYPVNCNDYFYITIPWSDNFWGEGILSFFHKYDTDTLTDGGIIEMSYNKGVSWMNILADKNHISVQFIGISEDTIRGGEYGFSGRSEGWQYVELYWWWIALVKKTEYESLETPMIRFRFVSDGINTNKEGWMIDDIVFRGYDVVGNINDLPGSKILIFPQPADEYVNIDLGNKQFRELTFSIYELTGRLVKNQKVINKKVNVSGLNPGVYVYRISSQDKILARGKLVKK